MKFEAHASGQKYQLEIDRDGEKVFARVDGREYALEASEVEPDVFLLKHEGRVVEVFVTRAGDTFLASVNGADIDVRLIDPKRLRGRGTDDDQSDGLAEIRTQMPGKVVRLILNAGDEVEKGHGVLVVEAMKMQNELKSPKHGIVKEIRVKENETVAAGDVLAIIE